MSGIKLGFSSVGTNYTLVVFEEGIYSVKVTNSSVAAVGP
jgi:hypothetical protein